MSHPISRRGLLVAGVGVMTTTRLGWSAATTEPRSATVKIENFAADGTSQGIVEVTRVVRTEDEWRKLLPPGQSFAVTRLADTEPPWSNHYDRNRASGLYRCICCNTALFDSKTKFDSRTGWPSFWQSISKLNVSESVDYKMIVARTAVSCTLCDAHLGHMFDDGPRPTGLRYCMNSVAMNFVKRA